MNQLYSLLAQIDIKASDVGIPKISDSGALFDRIVGLVYVAIAAISLLFVIRGALLYVTHGGESNTTKEARETILYALVALVGSSLVFVLIQFVLNVAG